MTFRSWVVDYHGEPSGIEYTMIRFADWNQIKASKFDPENKVLNVKTGYPKLYRTDTIEEDFPNAINKFWKCPRCGALTFFDKKGKVTSEYIPNTDIMPVIQEKEWTGICFDDHQWDELTEAAFPNGQLSESLKKFYEIYLSEDELVLRQGTSGKLTKYNRML